MKVTEYPTKDEKGCITGPATLFVVESETNPGQKYPVTLGFTCSCPDYMYRQKRECKHTREVYSYILKLKGASNENS